MLTFRTCIYYVFLLYTLFVTSIGKDFAKISIGPIYILDTLLIIVTLALTLHSILISKFRINPHSKRAIALIIIFIAYGLYQLLFNSTLSTLAVRDFAIFAYAGFAIFTCWCIRTPEQTTLYYRTILLGAAIQTFIGIFNTLNGIEFTDDGRHIKGTDAIYIMLGFFICITFPQAIPLKIRSIRLGLIFFLFCGILMSVHRSYLAAIPTTFFVYWLATTRATPNSQLNLIKHAKKTLIAIIPTIFISYIAFPFIFDNMIERTAELFSGNSASLTFRAIAWSLALEKWLSNPITGEGLGLEFTFTIAGATFPDVRPHNMYLTILYKSGAIGLSIFLALLLSCFNSLNRQLQHFHADQLRFKITATNIACTFCLSFIGVFNLMIESPFLSILFWSLIGMTCSNIMDKPRQHPTDLAIKNGKKRGS